MKVNDTREWNRKVYVPAGKVLCVEVQKDVKVKQVLEMLEGKRELPAGVRTVQL